jgi:U3 small nucleolar RNA-associated protein 21
LQSGNDRGLFGLNSGSELSLHSNEITGLGIDSLNHFLVSCSLDGTIKLWDFYRMKLVKSFSQDCPVENLVYNRQNDLIAVSSSDMTVSILNVKSGLKKVRTFQNVAENKITDLCFSQPDSKWLLTSSLDKSLKVFDILTGCLIDWIQFKQAPLSIDFSLSGEYLATSHVGSKAVFLWSNRAFFSNIVIQKVPE